MPLWSIIIITIYALIGIVFMFLIWNQVRKDDVGFDTETKKSFIKRFTISFIFATFWLPLIATALFCEIVKQLKPIIKKKLKRRTRIPVLPPVRQYGSWSQFEMKYEVKKMLRDTNTVEKSLFDRPINLEISSKSFDELLEEVDKLSLKTEVEQLLHKTDKLDDSKK